MSPKTADPAVRQALLDAAARMIAHGGGARLTLRRLADEVGTSTMAVYTHFGGMDELRRELRREWFLRLGDRISRLPTSDDPVRDAVVLAWTFYDNAVENGNLYQSMFIEETVDLDGALASATFQTLVATTQRCIDAGRFHDGDPVQFALQLFAAAHGIVSLALGGFWSDDGGRRLIEKTALTMFVGFGDHPRRARRSLRDAMTG